MTPQRSGPMPLALRWSHQAGARQNVEATPASDPFQTSGPPESPWLMDASPPLTHNCVSGAKAKRSPGGSAVEQAVDDVTVAVAASRLLGNVDAG
jgi:hypothetical protein